MNHTKILGFVFVSFFIICSCEVSDQGADQLDPGDDDDLDGSDGNDLDIDIDNDIDGDADNDGDGDADGDGDGDGDGDTDAVLFAEMGPGTNHEYEPDASNSLGVDTRADGWLVLGDEVFVEPFLWVSNSAQGSVSKINTEEAIEVGRYYSGMSESRADPSRTSVDLAGDVFVGNRWATDGKASSVTKIASSKDRCVDHNGNGIIETSFGSSLLPRSDGSFVPAGQSTDECVVWSRGFDPTDPNPLVNPFGCTGIRAVASTAETGDDFEVNGHVWVGCWNERSVFKLHGNTGDLLQSYQLPSAYTYGFVLDSEERVWISDRQNGRLVWMNPFTGQENVIPHPLGTQLGNYGIAVDGDDRIWSVSYEKGLVMRYTPSANDPSVGTWDSLDIGKPNGPRGVAVDVDDQIWVMTNPGAVVVQIDGATFPSPNSIVGSHDIGDAQYPATYGTGVAIDFEDNVWGVSHTSTGEGGIATKLTVDRTGPVPVVVSSEIVPIGPGPYTYSDMTGYNLHHFTTSEGWYRQVFEACPNHSTDWQKIQWEAEIPADTSTLIRARAADQKADLEQADWIVVVHLPPDTPPKPFPDTLPEGHFIEIEARLYTEKNGATPAVGKIGFYYQCTDEIVVE